MTESEQTYCKCGCGQVIENPRMCGDKIIQEFIDHIHRSRWHNKQRIKIDKAIEILEKMKGVRA